MEELMRRLFKAAVPFTSHQTFSKFASQTYSKKSKAAYATYGYSAFLVYRGYEDSPYNTDNAWQEAEIFNFHYKHRDNFSSHLQSVCAIVTVLVVSSYLFTVFGFIHHKEKSK